MNSCVSNTVVNVPCEMCESSNRVTLTWLKVNDVMYCKCGCMINLKTEPLLSDIAKAEQPLFPIDE
jgi:hypothetical protein